MRLSDYEVLYDLPEGQYDGRGIEGVRTRTWRAGQSVEVTAHPIVRYSAEAKREAKSRKTGKAAAQVNARNTQRHIMRLLEANFTTEAVVITGSYSYPVEDYGLCDVAELQRIYEERKLPWELERVRQDIRNWRERMARRVRAVGGDAKRDFKWLVRIEEGKEPPGVGLPAKYHFHAVIEGPGLDKETVRALWEQGGWRHGHVDMLDLSDSGAARLSKYFTKQKLGGRWWSHSRNLIDPQPTVSDRKISRRRLALIAADVSRNAREIFGKLYPGYKLVEVEVRYSDFVQGAYIYARLRRAEDVRPPWERAKKS